MKATHTKGPWKLSAGRNIETESGEFYITYGKDRYGNPVFRDFVELDRNARLIASAPELLAALQIALSDIEDFYQGFPTKDEFCGTEKLIRAAIAKATGEEVA